MRVLSQLDVQRRGGACAKAPSSCVVRDLLREAGLLRPLQPIRVLDMTYGQGVFYVAFNARVAGFDVKRLEWRVKPALFYQEPCWAWRRRLDEILRVLGGVDVVAVDPPWANWYGTRSRKARMHYSQAVGTPMDIIERCGAAAARLLGVPMLYHYAEPLRYRHVAGPVEFHGRSRYIREPRPSFFGVVVVG